MHISEGINSNDRSSACSNDEEHSIRLGQGNVRVVLTPESEKSLQNNHTCQGHDLNNAGYEETSSHLAQQKRLMDLTKTDTAEEEYFEKIYNASDILDLPYMRDEAIKEVVKFITEVSPSMKDKFDCLVKDNTRKAVEDLKINIFRKG